jgi:hypothetical protein
VHTSVTLPDGSTSEGKRGSKLLHERVCWLKPGPDWECLQELINAIESAVTESREMLVKCHAKFVELNTLKTLLDRYRSGERKAAHLTERDVRGFLDRHYPTDWCKKVDAFVDLSEADGSNRKDKKAYLKSGKPGVSDQFSIITVTLALGKQLLLEHSKA